MSRQATRLPSEVGCGKKLLTHDGRGVTVLRKDSVGNASAKWSRLWRNSLRVTEWGETNWSCTKCGAARSYLCTTEEWETDWSCAKCSVAISFLHDAVRELPAHGRRRDRPVLCAMWCGQKASCAWICARRKKEINCFLSSSDMTSLPLMWFFFL